MCPPLLLLGSALALTACGSGPDSPFANPFTQSIQVTLNPSSVTLSPGATTQVQVTGTANGSAVTGLNITAADVPTGLTLTPSTGQITVAASTTLHPGTYAVPLQVTAPGGQGSAQLAITVKAPDYSVAFSGNPISLAAGSSVRVSLTATQNGANAPLVHVVKVTGALNVTLDQDPVGFTVSVPGNQTLGAYVLQVTTSDGITTRVDPLTVNVTEAAK
ncbi:hypothetical protein GCM10008957_27210 [Deinococcus ruber]|uniref:Cell surface protein n=1 Tax=Deinococcus ruber TaxID=1848197 RepID=A0A918C9T4_9DEIO|nr:hypothetical protein GCM10008957_27210 [Deinococcus ruber]